MKLTAADRKERSCPFSSVLPPSNTHEKLSSKADFFLLHFQQEQGGTSRHVTFAVSGKRGEGLACMHFVNYLQRTANDMEANCRKLVHFEYHNKNTGKPIPVTGRGGP
jgi:hypothetical protein